MNDEKLRFAPGDTTKSYTLEVETSDNLGAAEEVLTPMFVSEIHVIGEDVWIGRVTACGYTAEAAEALRDRLLWALNQPTVPAQFQYYEPEGQDGTWQAAGWLNLDNGGEAARLKGEGYEIRALYQKQPLNEV